MKYPGIYFANIVLWDILGKLQEECYDVVTMTWRTKCRRDNDAFITLKVISILGGSRDGEKKCTTKLNMRDEASFGWTKGTVGSTEQNQPEGGLQ